MLEHFIFSVNAVVPMFVIMAVGYVIRKLGWTDAASNKKMNNIVFGIGLPTLMFRDISASDLQALFDAPFLAFAFVSTTVVFVVTMYIGMVWFKNRKVAATFSQSCFRSNFAILGLPLSASVLGADNMQLALLAIAFIIPLYNIYSAIAFAGEEGESLSGMKGVKIVVKNLCNPITYGVILAVGVSLLRIPMPVMVTVPVNHIASLTTPLALLVIGGSIDYSRALTCIKPALWISVLKLVIAPLVFIPIAALLGFESDAIAVIFLMLATPTAISSYAMAVQMGGDEDLVLNSILFTMTFAIFTLTFGIFILRTFGLI